MSEYYHIVPWFNSSEWLQAYENIFKLHNKETALQILLIWKARCPSLPSGIESTLSLLQVLIQDENTSSMLNDQLLRLAYSSAVMRFVNHMLDTETAKGTSLYKAAKNKDVPDWIIDLRHDTAHSNNLPSIELLREASQIGLEWLEKNYWIQYKECINNFVTGGPHLQPETPETNKIASMMHFCTSLSFCAHSKCKFKNLKEIPDPSLKESLVNDARDLFGDHYDFSNLKAISVQFLVNILDSNSKVLLKNKDAILCATQSLLGEDSLILSLEILDFMGNKDFHHKNRLSPHYMQCFELLLTFLHSNDILQDFVLELIEITNKCESNDSKCLLAALWVSEILKALGKSKQFIERLKSSGSTDIKSKKNHELRSLYHHWFPNEKDKGILLNMQKSVPPQLMDIEYLQPIIATYNPYLKFFIKDLLNLVEPPLPKPVKENISNLADLISSPDKFPAVSSKIYTVEDLMEQSKEVHSASDCDMKIVTPEEEQEHFNVGIWKLCSRNYDWNSCPIGGLPWQEKGFEL